jgi:BNR repeat-like domain
MKSKPRSSTISRRFSWHLTLLVAAGLTAFCFLQIRADPIAADLANGNARALTHPTRVSRQSPFPDNCATASFADEINYQNAEVEPWIAVDPTNANHLIGVWQQDRWQFGGARGLGTAVSWNGGHSRKRTFVHFTICSGGTAANGGDYERASDPWVTISPNGVAFQSSLSFNFSDPKNAVLVSRSFDGGQTWSEPVTLRLDTDPSGFNDKETITADPTNSRFVYAVWDRNAFDSLGNFLGQPTWFARTTNGGDTWEAARMIFDAGLGNGTLGNQIVVLPNGILVNVFTLFINNTASIALIRSSNHGVTWSEPISIAAQQAIGVVNPKTGEYARTSSIIEAIAVDQKTGALFVVWEDGRFSGYQREGIAFSKSTDGGLHWTAPVQINTVPAVQAFTPSIAVGDVGTISVTYYDFRQDNTDPDVWLANYWRLTSVDGGLTWTEVPVAGPFDLREAPRTSACCGGFFLGDYEGIVPGQRSFKPIYVLTNSQNGRADPVGHLSNPTDVFVSPLAVPGDISWNGHVERNPHPRSARELISLHQERLFPHKR